MEDSFFSKVFASLPMRPSVETTNGVKIESGKRENGEIMIP
jgi:hypothetical protein